MPKLRPRRSASTAGSDRTKRSCTTRPTANSLYGEKQTKRIEDEDIGIPEELLKKVSHLSRDEYDVEEIINETYLDLDQIVDFLAETQKFESKHDDKLNKLKRLLKAKTSRTGRS